MVSARRRIRGDGDNVKLSFMKIRERSRYPASVGINTETSRAVSQGLRVLGLVGLTAGLTISLKIVDHH